MYILFREPSIDTISSLGCTLQDEQFIDQKHHQSTLKRVQVREMKFIMEKYFSFFMVRVTCQEAPCVMSPWLLERSPSLVIGFCCLQILIILLLCSQVTILSHVSYSTYSVFSLKSSVSHPNSCLLYLKYHVSYPSSSVSSLSSSVSQPNCSVSHVSYISNITSLIPHLLSLYSNFLSLIPILLSLLMSLSPQMSCLLSHISSLSSLILYLLSLNSCHLSHYERCKLGLFCCNVLRWQTLYHVSWESQSLVSHHTISSVS